MIIHPDEWENLDFTDSTYNGDRIELNGNES